MAKLGVIIFLLVFLFHISQLQSISLKFTNITCECKDSSFSSVAYCYVKQVNPQTNYVSLRYMMHKPMYKDIDINFKFMINRNGWQQFLYTANIDFCRFMKIRYNAIAKLIFAYIDNHTNMNHSCPYTTEKYLAIDKIVNTEVAKKLPGIPFSKGYYALFSQWVYKNVTLTQTNIYFEVLNS